MEQIVRVCKVSRDLLPRIDGFAYSGERELESAGSVERRDSAVGIAEEAVVQTVSV